MWPLIGLAGFGAGALNSMVGSGTLLTFPTLLAFGVPPVVANVSNNLGLVPGSLAAYLGNRHEIAGSETRLSGMLGWSTTGAFLGAFAVIKFPAKSFESIVPFLILLGVALMLLQPVIVRMRPRSHTSRLTMPIRIAIFLTGIYGGYFGAAQGVILIGLLSAFAGETLFRANAIKNALAGSSNFVAGIIFIFIAPVNWAIVLTVAIGSTIGASVGAKYGRKIPKNVYRGLIVVVGVTAALKFWLG
ncbi:MAG TPA: sulfite exporter TauE/SafE family protein [Candidatus Nanopelagicaceae bacterium]|nr:sulfite exporter TauE/SafE family protein [Candidatus Nanopelagicaceae bacterium]